MIKNERKWAREKETRAQNPKSGGLGVGRRKIDGFVVVVVVIVELGIREIRTNSVPWKKGRAVQPE